MPKQLEPGVLYVSEEFGTAAHLCACGCGSKVRTPLGPAEWSFEEWNGGPTLSPSIGNWQLDCRSHYWIRNGRVVWGESWTDQEIAVGRLAEEQRRQEFYDSIGEPGGVLGRLWSWIRSWFTR